MAPKESRSDFSVAIRIKVRPTASTLLFSLLWAMTVLAMSTYLYAIFDHSWVQGSQEMNDFMRTAGGVFCAVFLGPFVEELIFRGVFLKFFIDKNRVLLGSIVVSIVFSLFHGLRERTV